MPRRQKLESVADTNGDLSVAELDDSAADADFVKTVDRKIQEQMKELAEAL